MTTSPGLLLERRREATDLEFRRPRAEDGPVMWRIAAGSGLDLNSQYSYLMVAEFFSSTSIVAEADDEIVGFVSGFRPPDSSADLFVWQIAVKDGWQGNGIASRMLDQLALRHRLAGGRFVTATITPTNEASQRTFKSLARRLGTRCEATPMFDEDMFAGDGHEAEDLYRIGPIR